MGWILDSDDWLAFYSFLSNHCFFYLHPLYLILVPAFYNLAKKIISNNGGVQAAGVASPKLVKLGAGGGSAQKKKKPCRIG